MSKKNEKQRAFIFGALVGIGVTYVLLKKNTTSEPGTVIDTDIQLNPGAVPVLNGTSIPRRLRKSNMPGIYIL